MEEEPALNAAYVLRSGAPPSPRFPTNLDFLFFKQGFREERLRGFPKVTQPIKGRTGIPNTDSHSRGSMLFSTARLPFVRVPQCRASNWVWENPPLRTRALALRI